MAGHSGNDETRLCPRASHPMITDRSSGGRAARRPTSTALRGLGR